MNVNTVQELSIILSLDFASDNLGNEGGGERDIGVVNSIKHKHILNILVDLDCYSLLANYCLILFTSEEVSNDDALLVFGNLDFDGEVGSDESHLVSISLGDSLDHVVDEG